MAITISFFNSKGGTGKTAFTTIIATLLHNTTKAKVCIIDGDPQFDLIDNHKTSLEELKNTGNTEGIRLPPLNVIKIEIPENKSEEEYMNRILDEIEKNDSVYDFIFLNLRGTKHTKGIGNVFAAINHIFIPVDADKTSVNTGVDLLNIFHKMINTGKTNIKTVHLFKNRFSTNRFTSEWEKFDRAAANEKTPIMKSYIKELVEFSRSSYNTVYPIDLKVNLAPIRQKGRIYPFYLELLKIIKEN